jgi:alpha-glucosidase
MNRDDQYMVDFYRRAARAAAEHHLMLDFHDAFKPDGMERTWPNILTREAVLGLEYAQSGARPNAEHDVMLAFTRLLAGSMDYTPGGFNQKLSTRAHQLALFVIFESPLQTAADAPATYRDQPEFEFIKAVPATWDEKRALDGKVGEYVAVARRRGADWYVGAITNRLAREMDLPLTFLGPGEFIAEIYADTGIIRSSVNASMNLHLRLASGGGAAVRFRRQ